MKPRIIYQDKDIAVAYKPAGLATQTAKVGQPDMVSELKKLLKVRYLGVVHRLDQPVEGLLVFALTQEAAAKLTKQLSGGSLNKQYYAAVSGKLSPGQGTLVDYLIKTRDNLAQVVTGKESSYPDAKKAVLHYKIVEEVQVPALTESGVGCGDSVVPTESGVGRGDSVVPTESGNGRRDSAASTEGGNSRRDSAAPEMIAIGLADINIETGRFHQIRCQMANAGMPLLGDLKYGCPNATNVAEGGRAQYPEIGSAGNVGTGSSSALVPGTGLKIRNVALCAYKLVFQHPVTGKRMSYEISPENPAFEVFSGNNFGCDCLY